MMRYSDEEFDKIVNEAISSMPDRFLEALDNVSIVVEDEPSSDLDEQPGEGSYCDDELLGLYDGVNLVERTDGYSMDLPDVIYVFQGPHERCFTDEEEMISEVRKTVIHEIGHYFGLEDDRLYEMGY